MPINRRAFLKCSAAAAAVRAAGWAYGGSGAFLVDLNDPIAAAAPVRWAVAGLQASLNAAHVPATTRIAIAARGTSLARGILAGSRAALPDTPESLALVRGQSGGKRVLLACGSDVRGLVYAVLELKDRIDYAADPQTALSLPEAVIETPANRIRAISRCFVSDIEDKPWFYDREMWPQYLSMLAAQRFNRFALTFGIGYDFLSNIRDCYLHFAYPFLVSVPGYSVKAVGLPDEERDRNLEMLRFISNEAAARGLQFQLGLWTHGYQWTNSPHANYTISGLNAENHAAYSAAALHAVLQACPAITGVTFRIHGESGVTEGSYSFWKTVFDGIVRTGRKIEIDMHAKGIDQPMIDMALGTGLPVNVSPKYWAEHMGLPYHQAAIREVEMPKRNASDKGFFALSSGSRSFLRYGYGDLLAENRRYGVLHRMWPGTQRLLLWGDPKMAAAYGRASSFCGSEGMELLEPLSFKGRKGSGIAGGRCAYADAGLRPKWDWEKYQYTYRVWGRLLYNPAAEPDVWRRYLRKQFGNAAEPVEAALSNAGRILPLVTTAHLPSAANNNFWPEMYTNMPIVDASRKHPYGDTPAPKRFGTVSPLDPELFSHVDDFAGELLAGEKSGKYSPLQVAQWLDRLSADASKSLAAVQARERAEIEFRRVSIDVAVQSGLGRFFAAKLRSGVFYALYDRTGDVGALRRAIEEYRGARAAWIELADRAKDAYAADVTFGFDQHLRGHWRDRIAAIDADIADMERRVETANAGPAAPPERLQQALNGAGLVTLPEIECRHEPARTFQPGQPLTIDLSPRDSRLVSVRLHFRHVNQGELFQDQEMETRPSGYRAAIPAEYTNSPFPLLYFFEMKTADAAWIHPGLGPDLCNQPYYVVRQARTHS